MRKILASIILLCLVFTLASCGEKEHVPVGPAPQQPEPAPAPAPIDVPKEYAKALNDQNTAVSFLEGEWSQCPMGVIRDDETTTTVAFNDDLTAVITRDDGEFALCKYKATTLMEDEDGSIDLITFIPYEFSKNLISGNASAYIDQPMMFQFLACRAEGKDLLMMREPGNGESAIGYEVFGYNLLAGDTNAWIFCRNNDVAPRDREETLALRKKNSTFYAYGWCASADYLVLQEVEGLELPINWFSDVMDVTLVKYADNDHPLEAVFYDTAAIPGEGDMVMPDILQPMLGIATTDEEGIVTDFEQLDYIGYGVYKRGGTPNGNAAPISIMFEDGSVETDYPSYEECSLTILDTFVKLRVTALETVYDVKVVRLIMDKMIDNEPHFKTEECHHIDVMDPEKPLVITAPYFNDMPTYGLMLTDQNGQDHLYAVSQSGKDGSLLLIESHQYD